LVEEAMAHQQRNDLCVGSLAADAMYGAAHHSVLTDSMQSKKIWHKTSRSNRDTACAARLVGTALTALPGDLVCGCGHFGEKTRTLLLRVLRSRLFDLDGTPGGAGVRILGGAVGNSVRRYSRHCDPRFSRSTRGAQRRRQ
jgi:hypothetical protein